MTPAGRPASAGPSGRRATAQAHRPAPRDTLRRALRWYLLWNMVAFVGVVVAVVVVSWVVARNEALRDAEITARAVARTIVSPLADDQFRAENPAALARMAQVLENRARDGSIRHIKVWADAGNGRGRILYSDLKPLVGQTYELEEEEYAVFGTDNTVSSISDLEKAENKLERPEGELIEVYTGTRDATGAPILFETYVPTSGLRPEAVSLIRVILPLPILALIALSLTTLPLAISLARRVDRGQQQMQHLLVNAVESSDLERRRIAQDLHDSVVQDLAGIGYALDSEARRLPEGSGMRERLEQTGDILRRDLATVRTLMTDIYPPDLATKGLAEVVRELAVDQDPRAVPVRVEVSEPLEPHPMVDRLTYRGVREALTNAQKHAKASTIIIRIGQADGVMTFEVVDDGVGFDASAQSPEGHLGMRLLSEMATNAGGLVTVQSTPGVGTSVRGELPL
jgi:signal transduction histidine kinase